MSEHPNAAFARRLFDAFGRRDGAVLATLLHPDVVWRVGGGSPVAGEYRGRRAVARFLRMTTESTNGSYRSELRYAVADDEHAVAVYRATGSRDGREIALDMILLYRVADGRLVEVTAVPTNQAVFDTFWGG